MLDFNRLCRSVAIVYNCCLYLWLEYTEIVYLYPLFQRYVISVDHVIEFNLKRGFNNTFLMNCQHYLLNFLQKPAL